VILGKNSRAIVTGASKGIGRSTVETLIARGVTVGLIARGADALEELCGRLGANAMPLPADVTDSAAMGAAVETFVGRTGGIDLLVANAGVAHYGPFAGQDPSLTDQMVEVNVIGVINTVRAALDPMLAAGSGHIVVVSSGAGLRAFPSAAVYGGTKAFDRGFAEALRHELAGTGVSLTTVFPGEIKTDLHTHERQLLPEWRNNDEELPPEKLADAIVAAVESDRANVYLPGVVRLLGINGIAPRAVDMLLRRIRGRSAAPRK